MYDGTMHVNERPSAAAYMLSLYRCLARALPHATEAPFKKRLASPFLAMADCHGSGVAGKAPKSGTIPSTEDIQMRHIQPSPFLPFDLHLKKECETA